MLNKDLEHDLIKEVKNNLIKSMQTKAEKLLNPYNYHLSSGAKKRLRWLYILYYEKAGNVSRTSNKIGVSRQWLSKIKSIFERNYSNPRSLEPSSRAPYDVSKRKRIVKETEDKILEIRDKYGWGKEKIAAFLKTNYQVKVNHNTVNRYLQLNKRIDPLLSFRNRKASKEKRQRETKAILKVKFRPPLIIKDHAPGALIEKDMKYIAKSGKKGNFREDFWYQQTFLDSFTRIKATELTEDFESKTVALSYEEIKKRLPFEIACTNTDNGPENEKEFSEKLQKDNVFHFYSNRGAPTDNPRVERSFLSDDLEFYKRGNLYRDFNEQKEASRKWEYTWNYLRPHQALGYLTPIQFYYLWQRNTEEAYRITEKWQEYLKRQKRRQAQARRIKRKEQIEALMAFIDAKLNKNKGLKEVKLQLINCQLCSIA